MRKFLILMLLFLLSCVNKQQSDIISYYHDHQDVVDQLLVEHLALGQAVNAANDVDKKEAIDAYLLWVAKNRQTLEDYKLFIEENYGILEDEQPNPILTRDILKIVLEEIETNTRNFELYNRIWERYND